MMPNLAWLPNAIAVGGILTSTGIRKLSSDDRNEIGNWELLNPEYAHLNTIAANKLYPSRQVIAFSRRLDRDDVACLVVRDPKHPTGSVLVIHDGTDPGYELVEVFPSIDAWLETISRDA